MNQRLIISAAVGVFIALFTYARLVYGTCAGSPTCEAGDFTWSHRGAQQLLAGQNPYHDPTLGPGNPFPRNDPLFYPLPSLLVAMPLSPFPREVAGALFMGVSCGLLAYGLFREGFSRAALFLSAPFWFSVVAVQWSPLIVASALIPALLPLTMVKPNIGLPVFLTYPTWRAAVASVAILLISLLVLPTWPLDWLNNAGGHTVFQPLRVFPVGWLLLLAALRWRTPEARLLLLLALVPQRPIYDQLPIWLICQPGNSRAVLILSALSWLAIFGWLLVPALNVAWIVVGTYLPALAILLLNPASNCEER
ncbi:MAG: hypothetical protein HC884_07075 [Chloroflexaceae bacterium]|nr:hypothetical protein [Chloroflexaceae bacterium]